MSTETTGPGGEGTAAPDTDAGVLGDVPPEQRLDHDPFDDNGLGRGGPEDVSDVPAGEVRWLDGRDAR